MSDAKPPAYTGEQSCPKCGYVHVATKWIGRNRELSLAWRWASRDNVVMTDYVPIWRDYSMDAEILERECRRCEYRWAESVLTPEQQGQQIARAAFSTPTNP